MFAVRCFVLVAGTATMGRRVFIFPMKPPKWDRLGPRGYYPFGFNEGLQGESYHSAAKLKIT